MNEEDWLFISDEDWGVFERKGVITDEEDRGLLKIEGYRP